jgi:hypothetical protein
VRGWQWITHFERQVQLTLTTLCCAIVALSVASPKYYYRHHSALVFISRFLIIFMPAASQLIAGLLGRPTESGAAMSVLGMHWAYRNPLGALGIILFASRMPIIGIAPLYTPMTFGASLVSQIAMAIGASSTDHVMCSSPLAHGPGVLPWLKTVHWIMSGAWDLVAPAPWNPVPPPSVARPGVSLLAVTLLVRLACVLTPLSVNLSEEAWQYRQMLMAVARGGRAAAGVRLPKRAPVAARINLFFRRLRRYPVHAAFFGLACLELAWCACFYAAQHVCGV